MQVSQGFTETHHVDSDAIALHRLIETFTGAPVARARVLARPVPSDCPFGECGCGCGLRA